MTNWLEIGDLEDIPPRGARVVTTDHGDIAVFRTSDDRVFAVEDSCPHKKGPLSQGIVHGDRVTCPLHNWVINLADGTAVAPDKGCAVHYPVRVERGLISVDLAAQRLCPADPG